MSLQLRFHGDASRPAFARVVIQIMAWLKNRMANLRQLTGDDAYERYLAHHDLHHADQVLLDRRAFYIAEQQRKWTGVKRCC